MRRGYWRAPTSCCTTRWFRPTSFAAYQAVVGLAEQLERRDAVVPQCSPAERHVQILRREPVAEAAATVGRVGCRPGREDRELVASNARELVAGRERRRKRVGQAAELRISRRVPVRVVDRLEVVHVAEEQHERIAGVAEAREHLVEDARVEDARQEVAFGEVAQLLDVAAVLGPEPADECAARRERDEADSRGIGEHVTRG